MRWCFHSFGFPYQFGERGNFRAGPLLLDFVRCFHNLITKFIASTSLFSFSFFSLSLCSLFFSFPLCNSVATLQAQQYSFYKLCFRRLPFVSMRLKPFSVAIGLLAATVFAADNPINVPKEGLMFTAGKPTTFTWNPTTSGTVTLRLREGASSDLSGGTLIKGMSSIST